MKKKILNSTLGVLLASVALGASAQSATEELVYKITTQAEFDACTLSNERYDRDNAWSWYGYGANSYMRLWYYTYGSSASYLEDYVITPEIAMETGKLYRLECIPLSYNSATSSLASLDFLIGEGDDPSAYTLIKRFENLPYNSTGAEAYRQKMEFTVPADGNYHLSVLGNKNFAKVYDFRLYAMGESSVPCEATDLTVVPDANGGTSATISFTVSTQTITGQALPEAVAYTISCNDTSVQTGTAAPGSQVTWTDTNAPEGVVKYSVVLGEGENLSAAVEATSFIGLETPAAPVNPAFTSDGDTHTVTWGCPAGIHGVELDPAALVYTVKRLVNGEETASATVTGATTFTDTYAATTPVSLSYSITAANGTKVSDPAVTPSVKIGHIDLPFVDSFAGAQISANWDLESLGGNEANNWEAKASYGTGNSATSGTIINPVDEDGGFLVYRAWDFNSSHEGRLSTAPISRSSSVTPALEFYMHHDQSQSGKRDRMVVEISVDNGEWTPIEGAEYLRYDGSEGWRKESLALTGLIPADCSTYRIGFHAYSAYGANFALDAVRIFNPAENDIEVKLDGPAKLTAGVPATFTLTVSNNGTTPIEASAYTLAINNTLGVEIEAPAPEDLPGLSIKKYTVNFTADAEQCRLAESYDFSAKAEYADDTVPDNNESATVTVATAFFDKEGVSAVSVAPHENGTFKLEWAAAGTAGYSPLVISEDFESLEEGTTGEFNGFRVIDLDGKSASTYYMCNGSALNVFSPNTILEVHGEKALGVTCESYAQQNDWLITPALTAADESTFNLSFWIGFKKLSYSSTYTFDVLYATDDYDPAAPAEAFTHSLKNYSVGYYSTPSHDNKIHEFTLTDIPREAKYIAIHLNSKISSETATWIDDVKIEEINPAPLLGYNVYQCGVGRLNAEMLSNSELDFLLENISFPADGTSPAYYVTAVYPSGETMPSPMAVIEVPKAPANVAASLAHDIFTGRNDLTISWEAADDASDETAYEVSLNGVKFPATKALSVVAEEVASQEHLIEVCAILNGVRSQAATAAFTVSDDAWARASFTLTTNNNIIPEGVKVTVTGEGIEPVELPFGDDNKAEIGYLPKGTYTASAEAAWFKPWSATVELTGDTETPVSFEEIITAPYALTISPVEGDTDEEFRPQLLKWNTTGDTEMGYVLGYTVSLDGAEVGQATDTEMVLHGADATTHTAGVKADYASGSSEETTVVFTGETTVGIGAVSGIRATVTGLTGALRISVAGQAAVVVYNAAGQEAASVTLADETTLLPAAAGVYLVKVNDAVFKVAVK